MGSMTGCGLRDAVFLVCAALLLHAGNIQAQTPETPTTLPAPRDSSLDMPPELAPRAANDSSRAAFLVDSLTNAGPAEDAQALDARLQRLTTAATALPADERLVFDEVVAAAREMLSSGDLEAGRLLAADAIDVLRRGSP